MSIALVRDEQVAASSQHPSRVGDIAGRGDRREFEPAAFELADDPEIGDPITETDESCSFR